MWNGWLNSIGANSILCSGLNDCRTCVGEENLTVKGQSSGSYVTKRYNVGKRFDDDSSDEEGEVRPPKVHGFPSYSCAPEQPLRGVPLLEGDLWYLTARDQFEPVTFALYINGFSFTDEVGHERSVSLSPFSLVRNCRFQSGACAHLKSFKISLLDRNPCCYFAVRSLEDPEAEEDRSNWVLGISHTILLITESLLPPFRISCGSLVDVVSTYHRLMAGHLIHRDSENCVSVLYCELQAPLGNTARFVLYENELCQTIIRDLLISPLSVCHDVVGINCSCFSIDEHYFSSGTSSERKLWLRALSNVKVKLQNFAPPPTPEELENYRSEIMQYANAIEVTLDGQLSHDALLERVPRKAFRQIGDGDTEPPPAPPLTEAELLDCIVPDEEPSYVGDLLGTTLLTLKSADKQDVVKSTTNGTGGGVMVSL